MRINLAELERLAERATAGPWAWKGHWLEARSDRKTVLWYTTDDDGVHCRPEDADFIAACHPEAVKALIGAITNLHIDFMAGVGASIEDRDRRFRWVLAQHGIELGESRDPKGE